jgi:hypothetical protein
VGDFKKKMLIKNCDICAQPLSRFFVDGKAKSGLWAIMCSTCHFLHGCGLGDGRGQSYVRQSNNRWLKYVAAALAALCVLSSSARANTQASWTNCFGNNAVRCHLKSALNKN